MQKDTLMCRFKFLFFLIFFSSYSFAQVNTSNIEIVRDKWGVPHIYGKTDKEAAYGLAWAHAEDDFATIQCIKFRKKNNYFVKYREFMLRA